MRPDAPSRRVSLILLNWKFSLQPFRFLLEHARDPVEVVVNQRQFVCGINRRHRVHGPSERGKDRGGLTLDFGQFQRMHDHAATIAGVPRSAHKPERSSRSTIPVIAPVVNPESAASWPGVSGPCSSRKPRHFHSALLMPSRAAIASWNRMIVVLSARPRRSPGVKGLTDWRRVIFTAVPSLRLAIAPTARWPEAQFHRLPLL